MNISSLTKNLCCCCTFEMVLWGSIVFAIFLAVQLKTYWKNNYWRYWRFLQNQI
jgi:hypothetical protein